MSPDTAGHTSAGILISLDALIIQRADSPTAIDEAPVALRRIGWIGRPIILVGPRVAGRDLPVDAREREAWVRGSIGSGAYAVVPFEDPATDELRRSSLPLGRATSVRRSGGPRVISTRVFVAR